jgi:hypothetical protein
MHGGEGRDMPPDEFADIPNEYRIRPRANLEEIASAPPGAYMPNILGYAKAELLRRGREYAEEQENSQREWETTHQAARQKFEEELAQRQMDHASRLAREQLDTAQAAATAAKWAAVAAGVAALGAIGQLIVAFVR